MKKRTWLVIIIIFIILAVVSLFYFFHANSAVCPASATLSAAGECIIPPAQINTTTVPDFPVRFEFLKRYFGIGQF